MISIYDDRIEFISVGGLLPGIELEDVMAGLSVCRNENLANVFYRLQLIEAYGTGLRKIMKAYQNSNKKPEIQCTNHSFKIILPNMNVENEDVKVELKFIDDKGKVLKVVNDKGFVTRTDVESLLEVSASTASRLLRSMVESKILKQIGKGKGIRYII